MAIWTRTPTKEDLLKSCQNTAVSHMGIEFLEVGDNFLKGRMPVDKRTVQPFGVLHGGSSVLLAETLGSMAANYCLRDQGTVAVGLEINANHLRPVTNGWVYGTATAIHLGSATQVWDIVIENEQGKKTCVSRLTMAVTKAR
ncbi:MAG: 1,4-dihydroxy-2-naphthoyl-CoA hydrolase [Marinobacter psychrophilus]|uniref:hotdog fold thioesterase n=1 Tax=Marinobacter psychrophilus TaxID=330734 RepID=UPI0039E5D95D